LPKEKKWKKEKKELETVIQVKLDMFEYIQIQTFVSNSAKLEDKKINT
jgi:hypothetical protein